MDSIILIFGEECEASNLGSPVSFFSYVQMLRSALQYQTAGFLSLWPGFVPGWDLWWKNMAGFMQVLMLPLPIYTPSVAPYSLMSLSKTSHSLDTNIFK
jgi:hypothetical protein